MTKWIKVEDCLPTQYEDCWVSNGEWVDEDTFVPDEIGNEYSSNAYEGIRVSDGWYNFGTADENDKVKYWMPKKMPRTPEFPIEHWSDMTKEHALKYLLANWFDGDDSARYMTDGDEEHMAIKLATMALEKEIARERQEYNEDCE